MRAGHARSQQRRSAIHMHRSAIAEAFAALEDEGRRATGQLGDERQCAGPSAVSRCDNDVAPVAGILEPASPSCGPYLRPGITHPRIVAARNKRAREGQLRIGQALVDIETLGIARRHQQGAGDPRREPSGQGRHCEASEAVCDEKDSPRLQQNRPLDHLRLLVKIRLVPVRLEDAPRHGEAMLEPGLPVQGTASMEAGDDQRCCHIRAPSKLGAAASCSWRESRQRGAMPSAGTWNSALGVDLIEDAAVGEMGLLGLLPATEDVIDREELDRR